MNASLLAPVAALVSVVVWLACRRRPGRMQSATSTAAVVALNRAQISLARQQARDIAAADPDLDSLADPQPVAQPPLPQTGDARQRRAFLAQLRHQLRGDQPQRLAAIRLAARWADREALAVLRQGLRDVDLAVCGEAARAIERYRGRTGAARAVPAQLVLPRNVARTR